MRIKFLCFICLIVMASCSNPVATGRISRIAGNWIPYSEVCMAAGDSTGMIRLFIPMNNSSNVAAVAYMGMISDKIVQDGRYLKATFNVQKSEDGYVNLDQQDLAEPRFTAKDFPRKIKTNEAVTLSARLVDGKQRKNLLAWESIKQQTCGFEPVVK